MLMAAGVTSCHTDGTAEIQGVGQLSVRLEQASYYLNPDGSQSLRLVGYAMSPSDLSLTMTGAIGQYAHTWDSFDSFPQGDDYYVGEYQLSVSSVPEYNEGFDTPVFTGEADAIVRNAQPTDVTIPVGLKSVVVDAQFTPSQSSDYRLDGLGFMTGLGLFHAYTPDEERQLCLMPDNVEVFAIVTRTADGKRVMTSMGKKSAAVSGALYTIEATITSHAEVVLDLWGTEVTLPLSDALFNGVAPSISATWENDATLTLPEGDVPETPYVATVTPGGTPLSHLYLSMASHPLEEAHNCPRQVDLLNLSTENRQLLDSLGLDTQLTPSQGGRVDLTQLLGQLIYLTPQTDQSIFTLLASDATGLMSDPLILNVVTTPVEISIAEPEDAVMGVDRATIHVSCPSPGFTQHVEIEILTAENPITWTKVDTQITPTAPGEYDVTFSVPYGSEPVQARVLYCDEVRGRVTIGRKMPEFEIEVDALTSRAGIRVKAADPALTDIITSKLRLYIDGTEAPLYERYADSGILSVIGLKPSTTYAFKATMMSGVPDPTFTPTVKAKTEPASQLPNHSFEQRHDGPQYKDMPSGGRYSQTTVEIFNWQHQTSFDVEVPKEWANTNAKTFSTKAKNHNTWYMQPSMALERVSQDGTFSARVTSVAFDLDGEAIPDYVQTGLPYLDYSPVIPHIAHRAAGKIFLGKYHFDPETMTETYDEGLKWSTRPLSLNGYYRFLPNGDDRMARGLAVVEVLGQKDGQEIVLAHSQLELELALDFTAFSVPLEYQYFGIKATTIKVMFSSSSHIGSIDEETASIITTPDPRTATSTGGTLWVDNITLAY